jgi:hypothetical protein
MAVRLGTGQGLWASGLQESCVVIGQGLACWASLKRAAFVGHLLCEP